MLVSRSEELWLRRTDWSEINDLCQAFAKPRELCQDSQLLTLCVSPLMIG
jgi:hypothetical protein